MGQNKKRPRKDRDGFDQSNSPKNETKSDDSSSNPYRLNIQAVDNLVNANKENSPKVPAAELRKYHAGRRKRWPSWLKAVLLKSWMAGIICYFLVWGLSTIAIHQLDLMLILGIALGMCTNLITNNILRFIASPPDENDRWMMVTGKKVWFLPLDILYALFLVFCVMMTYGAINRLHGGETAFLGVEPILFGLFTMGWDMLFLFMKRMGKSMWNDATHKPGH